MLITGANGFVGASLCRYFYHKGYEIIATGRQAKSHPQLLSYATYFSADLTESLAPFDADVCIHAAGLASDTATYKNLYLNNVIATENILAASKHCKKVIYISSSSVYDFSKGIAKESSASLDAALSDYGKTKLQAEMRFQSELPEGQKRLILRPRAIYGIGDRVLLPRLLRMIKAGVIICPVADHIETSATHVDNLAYAIDLFLNQPKQPAFQVLNIADDCVYKLQNLIAKTLATVEGRKLRLINISKLLPYMSGKIQLSKDLSPIALKALSTNSVLDLTNIKKSLVYSPSTTFGESCLELGKWIKSIGGKKAYLKSLNEVPWLQQ